MLAIHSFLYFYRLIFWLTGYLWMLHFYLIGFIYYLGSQSFSSFYHVASIKLFLIALICSKTIRHDSGIWLVNKMIYSAT